MIDDEDDEEVVDEAPAGQPTKLPWIATPCQSDHGESTCIGRKDGEFVVCRIDSACWDPKAKIEYPEDRQNMKLILSAVNNIDAVTALLQEAIDGPVGAQRRSWTKRAEAALKKARKR